MFERDKQRERSSRTCINRSPQASYPCGNFSDTSRQNNMVTKGSIGPALTVVSLAEDSNKGSLSLSGSREVSAHVEESHRTPALSFDRCAAPAELPINMVSVTEGRCVMSVECRRVRRMISKEVVFQCRGNSHICYILQTTPRSRLESSSTGSSFPAEYFTPVPMTVISLDNRLGQKKSR